MSGVMHIGELEAADSRRTDGEFFDRYTVEVAAGQVLTVDMRSEEFDTFLFLTSPAPDRMENDDHEGSIRHSRIQVVAGESGEWEILATSFTSGATGEYEVIIKVGEGGQ